MITGPLMKVFGSKWQLAKYMPEPQGDTIVEPFAGGAGYSLRHFKKNVVVAERNEHLRTLWYWLIREATDQDILEIPVGLPVGTDIRNVGLRFGQQLLLKSWQRTNNHGNCWTISPWGDKPGQWTANTRARVASEVGEIKHWQFSSDWARELFRHGLSGEETLFVDPPYQYNYQYGLPRIDYHWYANRLKNHRGQVIVCEALGPNGERPNWLPFEDFRESVNSRRGRGHRTYSRELLWTSNSSTLSSASSNAVNTVRMSAWNPSDATGRDY